ncbi:MAG: HU family DNA-binding protein [Desulfobulbaceae bacterium]
MNKKELIEQIAQSAEISKKEAGEALNGFINAVEGTLKNGGKIQLAGFGSFSVAKRAARTSRNPRTGQEMKIPARNVVKFKAGTKLAAAVEE